VTQVRRVGPPGLIASLAVVGVLLAIPMLRSGAGIVAEPRIPLLVLAGLWAAFELVALYLQFGAEPDDGHEVDLTEIPLALGLMFAAPTDVLLAGVGVPVLIELLRRRRNAIKQLFNGVTGAVEIMVAVSLYRALDPSQPFSVLGWIELSLAVMASGLVSALAVASVISLATGQRPGRDFVMHMVLALPVSLSAASLAFVAGLALRSGTAAVAPLVVSLAGLLILMWFSWVLAERHMNLTSLHKLGERLASTRDPDSIVSSALDAAREMLVAPQAAVYLPSSQDDTGMLRLRKSPDGSLVRSPVGRGDVPIEHGVEPDHRAVVAAAPLAAGHELVISVDRRRGASRPFRKEDARLLDMIARQTGAELHTAQLIERLRHDALHDSFTNLPNRRLLLDCINERLRAAHPVEVIWLGVHQLQAVNAALGYDHGDDLLAEIGRRLQVAAVSDGVVARVGGDEFAVLLPIGTHGGADRQTVNGLLGTLARPFLLNGVEVVVRASAGVAVGTAESGTTGQDVLRRADIAMRFARRTGRPFERYTPELDTATPERLTLAALDPGLEVRGELALYAQPQVRLSDSNVTGVEMLVRWNHPRLGLLPPGTFVPLAEQTGLDGPMTGWVLNAALKALASWRAAGLQLNVSVNVPPSALGDHQLRDLAEELLTLRDVPANHLILEITENALLTSTATASRVLEDLSSLGVRVSIDDFGTGFSSLSRLRHLPVNEIKIDRTFVGTMLHDDDAAAIVRSVVDLSRALGLSSVAEGVEDPQTYTALQQLGCDAAQGYLIAAPMPLDEFTDWIGNENINDRTPEDGASRPTW
jgi:diguanylate cyclase (GGDEF)-like protein